MIKTGGAKEIITPSCPFTLAGYAPIRKATGVHDELYVRALVIEAEEKTVLIQFDLIAIEKVLRDAVIKRLTQRGYQATHIILAASHTHSSMGHVMDDRTEPMLAMMCGSLSLSLIETLADKAAAAVKKAEQTLLPTSYKMKAVSFDQLGSNRADPSLPSDQQMTLIEFHRWDETKYLIYNLSCHPTILDRENTLFSGDFVGCVNEQLSQDYQLSYFINGSCGDMSARFTKKESSFKECERLSKLIVKAIEEALMEEEVHPLNNVTLHPFQIEVKAKQPLSMDEALKNLEQAKKELETALREKTNQAMQKLARERKMGAELQLLAAQRTNDCTTAKNVTIHGLIMIVEGQKILLSPLELYSSLSLQLKEKVDIWTYGYINEHLGYMPDVQGYLRQDYESSLTSFASGAGELFIEEVLKIVNEIDEYIN